MLPSVLQVAALPPQQAAVPQPLAVTAAPALVVTRVSTLSNVFGQTHVWQPPARLEVRLASSERSSSIMDHDGP
jgi:hypothetical protein